MEHLNPWIHDYVLCVLMCVYMAACFAGQVFMMVYAPRTVRSNLFPNIAAKYLYIIAEYF